MYVAQKEPVHPGEYDGKKGREYLQGFQSGCRTILISIYEFDICAEFKNQEQLFLACHGPPCCLSLVSIKKGRRRALSVLCLFACRLFHPKRNVAQAGECK